MSFDPNRELLLLRTSMMNRTKQSMELVAQNIERIISMCAKERSTERTRGYFADFLSYAYDTKNDTYIRILETLGVEDMDDYLYDSHNVPHRIHNLSPEEKKIVLRLQKLAPVFAVRKRVYVQHI
jgi:hypothetical protein